LSRHSKTHANVEIPKNEDKLNNAGMSLQRDLIENMIREIKIFRILPEKYSNRRKKYGLRFNLIAAVYLQNIDL
jgi:hypothetical protein